MTLWKVMCDVECDVSRTISLLHDRLERFQYMNDDAPEIIPPLLTLDTYQVTF